MNALTLRLPPSGFQPAREAPAPRRRPLWWQGCEPQSRGGAEEGSLPLRSCATNLSSSSASRNKVRVNYAIEGPSLPRRSGAVFLPSASAATNGRFLGAAASDRAAQVWLAPRWPPDTPPPCSFLPGPCWGDPGPCWGDPPWPEGSQVFPGSA